MVGHSGAAEVSSGGRAPPFIRGPLLRSRRLGFFDGNTEDEVRGVPRRCALITAGQSDVRMYGMYMHGEGSIDLEDCRDPNDLAQESSSLSRPAAAAPGGVGHRRAYCST